MAEIVFGNPSMAVATKNRKKSKRKKTKGKKRSKAKAKKRRKTKGKPATNRTKGGSRMAKAKGNRKGSAKNRSGGGSKKNKSTKNRKRGGKKRKKGKKKRRSSHNRAKKNSAKKNQRRTSRGQLRGFMASIKNLPNSLIAAAAPILVGTGLFRIDDLFVDRVTDLVGVEPDSAAGKGVRAGTLMLIGVAIDGLFGRRKAINWTWGELVRNLGLIKLASETFEDFLEPALGLEKKEEEVKTVQGPETEVPIELLGGMGRSRGNGRFGRAGALVRTQRPIFG
jgi:hypothetical protein